MPTSQVHFGDGLRVQPFGGFRASGSELWVSGSGLKVSTLGFQILRPKP